MHLKFGRAGVKLNMFTVKKLLKKYKYSPEGMDDAVQVVMMQCELWTDNNAGEQMSKRMEAYVTQLQMK